MSDLFVTCRSTPNCRTIATAAHFASGHDDDQDVADDGDHDGADDIDNNIHL